MPACIYRRKSSHSAFAPLTFPKVTFFTSCKKNSVECDHQHISLLSVHNLTGLCQNSLTIATYLQLELQVVKKARC